MAKIGIDIDGTITVGEWIIAPLNEGLNINLKYEDLTTYDCYNFIDLPKETVDNWFRDNEAFLYKNPLIREHAIETIEQWKEENEIFLISARAMTAFDITKGWLDESKVSYNKLDLIGSHDKIAACKKYGIEIFMEDRLENAIDISRECNIPVILFDTPYNRVPLPKNVIRVFDWNEARVWVENWMKTKKALDN